jgi:hypothetical protein
MPLRSSSAPPPARAEGFSFAARRLLDAAGGVRLAPFLADWPDEGTERAQQPQGLPVLRWLRDLAAGANETTAGLTAWLVGAAERLQWRQTYGPDDFGPAFLERYGWTELIGTRGPVPSTSLACGFLLLGPGIDYPDHRHEAEEIYLPLSGTALWSAGGSGWAPRPPGSVIHHPSWTPHAMRTQGEPLLAMYLWRAGDLAQKSLIG